MITTIVIAIISTVVVVAVDAICIPRLMVRHFCYDLLFAGHFFVFPALLAILLVFYVQVLVK